MRKSVKPAGFTCHTPLPEKLVAAAPELGTKPASVCQVNPASLEPWKTNASPLPLPDACTMTVPMPAVAICRAPTPVKDCTAKPEPCGTKALLVGS
jgi:hypothetical protein